MFTDFKERAKERWGEEGERKMNTVNLISDLPLLCELDSVPPSLLP